MTPQITIIMLAFVAANLPWFSEKLLYVMPLRDNKKNLAWCLLELVLLYICIGVITKYAETSVYGQTAAQGWEFYVVTFSLFLVFAFPGFIYRILWEKFR